MGVLSGVKGHSPFVASNSYGQARLKAECSGGAGGVSYSIMTFVEVQPGPETCTATAASEAKNSTVSRFPEGG